MNEVDKVWSVKDQFVNRELSEALKEIGFDDNCIAHHGSGGLTLLGHGIAGLSYMEIEDEDVVFAPMYGQVWAWFESRGFTNFVEPTYYDGWRWSGNLFFPDGGGMATHHETRREAENELIRDLIQNYTSYKKEQENKNG